MTFQLWSMVLIQSLIGEKPDAMKVARPVLKTSRIGDNPA
jgi:hypothetical protein